MGVNTRTLHFLFKGKAHILKHLLSRFYPHFGGADAVLKWKLGSIRLMEFNSWWRPTQKLLTILTLHITSLPHLLYLNRSLPFIQYNSTLSGCCCWLLALFCFFSLPLQILPPTGSRAIAASLESNVFEMVPVYVEKKYLDEYSGRLKRRVQMLQ